MNAISISVGNVIQFNGKFWIVTKKEHIKTGRSGFVQVEMKDIKTGSKGSHRFRSSEEVEKAHMEDKEYQYQYMEGENLSLMDMESYESILLSKTLVGNAISFLKEGMDIKVTYCDETPIEIKLPETVILAVESTEGVVKGQTAASSYKPAILENGVRVMVPPFITNTDKIVVRTIDGTYVERAK
jgi:elongation factor P